ncbi:MAG: alternative ribosome rescue aminoacyl-tRNA hydrolase ArfB [Spirochaetota bacterium]
MRAELEDRIRFAARERFSRSGGPGGQNVNKVNTQVTVHVPLAELDLSEDEARLIRERLGARVTGDDELVVQCSETRSQARNREIALDRATALIREALRPRKRRRPTRPSKAARENRLEGKRRRAQRKQMRRPPQG